MTAQGCIRSGCRRELISALGGGIALADGTIASTWDRNVLPGPVLVPAEYSSGERTRRGHITKAGSEPVRSALTEAAWSYRHRPAIGAGLGRRQPALHGLGLHQDVIDQLERQVLR